MLKVAIDNGVFFFNLFFISKKQCLLPDSRAAVMSNTNWFMVRCVLSISSTGDPTPQKHTSSTIINNKEYRVHQTGKSSSFCTSTTSSKIR